MNKNQRNQKELAPSLSTWFKKIILDWDSFQMAVNFGLLGLIALAPLFIDSSYYLGIIIVTLIYAFVGVSWNIIAGFTGQLLIAHISFIAIGAYTTIVLLNKYLISPWLGIWVGGFFAAVLGIIVALITLRYGLKLDYFALFTIALMVALRTLFKKWDYVGGAVGMWFRLENPSFGKMIFASKVPYLYITLGLVLLGLIFQYYIYKSKIGKYLLAIRDDEDAAAALGVNTSLYKTVSVAIGAFMGGVGGGIYMMYVTFIEPPQVFDLGLNVEIVMTGPIIGGLGTLSGPLLGALLNKPVAEIVRAVLASGRSGISQIVYGSFLIVTILFLPYGVTGVIHNIYEKLTRKYQENR